MLLEELASRRSDVIPAGYTPTLLEQLGIDKGGTAEQYCQAITRYLLDRDHPYFVDEITMFRVMGSHKRIPRFLVDERLLG